MSKSALANLTAQYTDSENEEDHHDEESPDSFLSQASQVKIPENVTPTETPEKSEHRSTAASSRRQKKALRLVSYQDDTVISDDEANADEESSNESDSSDDSEYAEATASLNCMKERGTPMEVDDEGEGAPTASNISAKTPTHSGKTEKLERYAHYGFSLPPEPKGKPSVELLEKIRHLYEKMGTTNMDMNRIIQERKEFRNPSIYEKLIQFCDINEFGTNYPPEIYDPLQWGAESYYEELARVQKNEMLKRQKERKDNDKIEQATALARKVEEEAKKRKSKWDQPAPVKAAVQTALTTTVTGTKGTVISAFGSLPKKPAA